MSFLPIFMKEFYPYLNIGNFQRAETFKKAIEYFEKNWTVSKVGYSIIETGITRTPGNWGDGQSSLIWDALLAHHGGRGVSIDINETYVTNSRKFLTRMQPVCGDSVKELADMPRLAEDARIIYLDSYDLDQKNPMPSAMHHLMELTAIYARLQQGALVMVDDCISDSVGKHILVKQFMEKTGREPLFTGYQWGWII